MNNDINIQWYFPLFTLLGSQKSWLDCSRLWFIDTQHCVYIKKHQLVNLCCSEIWNWNLFEDIQFIITIILCRPIYRYHWCSRMDVLICKQGFGVGQCFEEKHWIPTQGIYHFNIHISHIHMSDKLMCLNGVGTFLNCVIVLLILTNNVTILWPSIEWSPNYPIITKIGITVNQYPSLYLCQVTKATADLYLVVKK